MLLRKMGCIAHVLENGRLWNSTTAQLSLHMAYIPPPPHPPSSPPAPHHPTDLYDDYVRLLTVVLLAPFILPSVTQHQTCYSQHMPWPYHNAPVRNEHCTTAPSARGLILIR